MPKPTGPRRFVVATAWQGRRRILPAVVLTATHQLCEIAVPVVVGVVIDRGIVAGDPVQLGVWLGVLAAVFLVLASSYRAGSLVGQRGVDEVGHALRMRVTGRMIDPRGFGDRARPVGEMLGIGGSDVRAVSGGLLLFVYPFAELAAIIAAGIVLFGIAWPLGVAVIAGGPVFLFALDRLSGALRRRVEDEQRRTADAATLAADAIAGYRTLSALGATRRAADRYRGASDRARQASVAARRTESLFVGATSAATGVFVVAIGLAAAVMALNGSLTIGQLITAVGVVQVVMGPLEALSVNVGAVWAWSVASGTRVLSVLDAPVERGSTSAATRPLADAADGLHVRGVTGDRIRRLDFSVGRDEIVGIVADGPTAAELVALVGGLRPLRAGEILLDRSALDGLGVDDVHRHITAAPHAAHVIEGTVLDNIGHRGERAHAALGAASFDDVLSTLPAGAQTILGPSGRSLSGGQRQRLGLARALASTTPVLVLHDPTTSVDAVTELAIARRLRAATRGRATLVVCTSPQLLAQADRVLFVSDAGVVAEGTHHELIAARPEYARVVS